MLAVSTRKLTNLLNKASHGRFREKKRKNFGTWLPVHSVKTALCNPLSVDYGHAV